jgi:hypothetical protein
MKKLLVTMFLIGWADAASAMPKCGPMPAPGPATCPGSNSAAAKAASHWDGCNGRAYDKCGRHIWVHYSHWRRPPAELTR